MEAHFLQTGVWQSFQEKLGHITFFRIGDGWHYLAIVEKHGPLTRLYVPYGPDCDSIEAYQAALKQLKRDAKEVSATYLRMTPTGPEDVVNYATKNLFRAQKNIQPADTVRNDITMQPDEIIARASQNARWLYRKNMREGVTFTESYDPKDITFFIDMIHDVAKRTGMRPRSDHYFKTLAETLFPSRSAGLLFAEYEGKRVASVLFLVDETRMYYAHAASYSFYRNLSPATALAMHAMLYAHQLGRKAFDFYGVAAEDAESSDPWQGFTKFKLGFGGKRVHLGNTWEMPLRRTTYRAYRGAAAAAKLLRGVRRRVGAKKPSSK